jgi:hypothetical protein
MKLQTINHDQLAKAFLAGAKYLQAEEDKINELNVFPVPDGDTGTNMTMTVMSAAEAVLKLEDRNMKTVSKAMSSGSLRGARGNSGVILSQLLRGFSKVVKTETELNVPIIAASFAKATETAYKAVMKPKEGTILTVARGMSDKAAELMDETDDILEFLSQVIEEGDKVLQKTPDMLPVLKEAGVVDSGGSGLMCVMKGAYAYLSGEDVDLSFGEEDSVSNAKKTYEYKLSFVLVPDKNTSYERVEDFASFLQTGGLVNKISNKKTYLELDMDTDIPGDIITKAGALGSVHEISFSNISDKDGFVKPEEEKEIKNNEAANEEIKEFGFVSVSAGEGISRIFSEMGVDRNITGGQTMNPSTDDILSAIEKVNAKTVFVLPNNKNIILAANQTVHLCEDKKVVVIPTTTIPQGITALINFLPDKSAEENEEIMKAEIANVKTGQITYAVRNTTIDEKEIKAGDFMGIGDKGILSVGASRDEVFLDMLHNMVDEESSLITIYYGADVTEEEAGEVKDMVASRFKGIEVELENGGQPVYYFIVSVE